MVVYINIKFLYFMFLCLVNLVLLVIIELILLVDNVLVGLFFIYVGIIFIELFFL